MASLILAFLYVTFILTPWAAAYPQNENTKKQISVMLLRVIPRTQEQLDFLNSLKNERRELRMQFWRHPDKLNRHVDVWLSQTSLGRFKQLLIQVGLTYRILSRDIVAQIGTPKISMNNIEDYDNIYQKVDDINSEMRRLATVYSDNLSLEVIGKSSEGRPIYSAHIHKNVSNPKPIVFVLCGSHAREWLGIASCQYVLRKILFDQTYDDEIKEMLNEYDVNMVPLLNPDGYSFTKKSRMWRKSRSKTTESRCRGVDINRNFNYRWGGGGSSPDPCEEIYCGPKPFSESESLALARYLYKIRRKLISFIDIHTYGQLWMSPWGFTTGFPRDFARQEYALKAIQKAIKEKNGMTYKIGRSATTLSKASGNAMDWVYGRLNVIHTYATELRPHPFVRYNGFEESGREITPSGEDLLIGVKAISQVILNENNAKH